MDQLHAPLSEDYHVSSRNQPASKHVLSSYKLHYEPEVQELQRTGPLEHPGERVCLTASICAGSELNGALSTRRSSRDFNPKSSISLEELSAVLIGSYGARDGLSHNLSYKRPVPTSGNLGSPEIFPVVRQVKGLAQGIYHFDSRRHDLAIVRPGDATDWLKDKVLFQPEHADGSAILFITSNVGRLKAKYGERGYRLALIDVGHVSQTVYLICASLGLRVCATAGFIDREADRALGIDGLNHATFLAITIGR